VRGSHGGERQVLVVEDREDLARELCGQLESLGHEARSVSSARDAEAGLVRPQTPTLAVLGRAPDGPDAMRALVEQLRAAGVPLVFLATGDGFPDTDAIGRLAPLALLFPPFSAWQLKIVLAAARAQHEELAALKQQLERATRLARSADTRRSVLEQRLAEIGALVTDGVLDLMPATPGAEAEEKLSPWRDVLSRQEFKVLHAFIVGRRVDRVTRMLALSPSTVRNHLKSIYRKSGVHSQAELIDAVNHGLARTEADRSGA